ncbi:MAG: hypothetical protein Q7T80_11800, partial [Methanoregula sp.]|nr:hypothetical protein [Methanoregula sp.]
MKKIINIIAIFCLCITVTSFSGCIESSFKKTETVITKLDSSQNVQWTTVIENKDYSPAQSLSPTNRFIQTSDKGFFIAGFFSNISGNSIRLLKTDSTGNLVWERRIAGQTGEILTIIQRNDRGYSVFCRDGRVYNFDSSGSMERIMEISDQINQTPGGGAPHITLRSITRTNGSDLMIIADNSANIWQPVVIARLSENGTVLMEKSYAVENMDGATSLIQTQEGGLLLGKFFYSDQPGGGKQILIEKTDANSSIVWDSPLGICNFAFCNNDLLGLHESANQGYDIIYQSHEQSNRSKGNMPVETVYARLDNNG